MSTKEVLNPAVNLIEWLERIASDRTLLRSLPTEARHRFHRAITTLSEIDPHAKRKRQKAVKAAGVRKAEAVLNDTGIRALRRRPMITTPNGFPPAMEQMANSGNPEGLPPPPPSVDRVCYVCKKPHWSSTISTINSARRAQRSTSPRAANWRTCVGESRCSPAAA